MTDAAEIYADLLRACRAAIAYDDAIQKCASDPKRMTSFCTAEGDDLDALYEAWIEPARAALKAIEQPTTDQWAEWAREFRAFLKTAAAPNGADAEARLASDRQAALAALCDPDKTRREFGTMSPEQFEMALAAIRYTLRELIRAGGIASRL